jgi:hypothetical protein
MLVAPLPAPAPATGRFSIPFALLGPPAMASWSLVIAPPNGRGWRACYAVSAWATIPINDPWDGQSPRCYELRAAEVVQALNKAYATTPPNA